MSSLVRALFVSTLLALPLVAQTTATATVRVGCTVPAPTNSMRPSPVTPLSWLPGTGDLTVMEVETVPASAAWEFNDSLTGFGGSGYYRWTGPDLFTQPGIGLLRFRFQAPVAGDYLLRIHSRHDFPDPSLQNDCWVRMDLGAWDKYFENSGPSGVGVWTFGGRLDSTGLKPVYTLTAGEHIFDISARSFNFKIDRVHVMPSTTFGESVSFPESELKRERPIIGLNFPVEIGDPNDEGGFTPGVALTYLFGNPPNANFPCGQVSNRFGEFLIALQPKPPLAGPPIAWSGPGNPAVHDLLLQNDPMLIGFAVSFQGFFLETGKSTVTDAIDVVLGDI